jgi:hypothetical protein
MKKKLYILLLLFPFWGLGGLSCSNDDDSGCVGIDCLPPATTTGEGTFGCLVNGEPYVDKSGSFNCFYQLVDGEYYFGIGSDKELSQIDQIVILSWMKEIEQGIIIPLDVRDNGNFFSEVSFDCICPNAVTTSQMDGFLISNEFTVTDPTTGNIYEITEGRFDATFTQ